MKKAGRTILIVIFAAVFVTAGALLALRAYEGHTARRELEQARQLAAPGPTATPEATPAPTPTAEPVPAPTAEPTPEPEPTVEPTPEPETTPDPDPGTGETA